MARRLIYHYQDDYTVVLFTPDVANISGKRLPPEVLLRNPARPADQFLRWHFRQAVLANMRGAGEPIFEIDFPPGSDMMSEILEGSRAAERMEYELFRRLALLEAGVDSR